MANKFQTAHSKLEFEPSNPEQDSFIWCTTREALFDGGIGNGKTTGGLMRLLILAKQFPGSRYVVARQTYKDLCATTRKTFNRVCPPNWIKRDVKDETELVNGSQILWMHLDDMDLKSLLGLEINGAFIDQAEEVSPDMYEALDSRIGRWWMPEWEAIGSCPPYIWATCNPNGYDWLYYRFCPKPFDERGHPYPFYRSYYWGETGINRKVLDKNSPGYYDSLMRQSEAFKRRFVFGRRDVFEGALHKDFKKDIHVYDDKAFNPYAQCKIVQCWGWFDYGLTAPTCCLISATTSDGFHFITRSYYDKDKLITEHAASINALVRSNPSPVKGIFADPSIFFESTKDRKVMTTSVSQEYRKAGLYMMKADNQEATSIANLHELFNINPALRNPITGKQGSPRLFIGASCLDLIEEIQMQRHAETRNPITGEKEFLEERQAGVKDHAYDPLRYFANSKIIEPMILRPQFKVPSYSAGLPKQKQSSGNYISQGSSSVKSWHRAKSSDLRAS